MTMILIVDIITLSHLSDCYMFSIVRFSVGLRLCSTSNVWTCAANYSNKASVIAKNMFLDVDNEVGYKQTTLKTLEITTRTTLKMRIYFMIERPSRHHNS